MTTDPMTTETAEMFMRQRDEALAEVGRLRAERDDWKVECAFLTDERDQLRGALDYVLRHHLDGQECLCDAARSVADAALRLTTAAEHG